MVNQQFCNRCLIIMNVTSVLVANTIVDGQIINREHCTNITDPCGVIKWAEAKLAEGTTLFDLDNMTRALIAITTWHGDPVCPIHLWECRARELHPNTIHRSKYDS